MYGCPTRKYARTNASKKGYKLKRYLFSITLLSCFLSSSLLAQVCNPKISATTPNERYVVHSSGIITDKKTGLEWSRCSIGQHWESDTCVGDAQPLLWSIASLVATTTEHSANTNKWRLPELKELTELVELQCAQPAINISVFPATPAASFWTGTRFANKDGSFWQVQFILGKTVPERGDYTALVRLVRSPK
jgi:hypothetical protein